jgi:hypothetical protein
MSLCNQFLTQAPELIVQACPQRWALCKIFGSSLRNYTPPWSIPELLQTLLRLISLLQERDDRLIIFIDGLDEFDSDDSHKALIDLVKDFSSKPDTKICVSSRPWVVFVDAFDANPSLQLQNFTRNDIEFYVKEQFQANRGFQELQKAHYEEMLQIVNNVVSKAGGVFLWVTIFTKTLLAAMTAGDNPSELQDALNDLPPDLTDLYNRIWSKLSPADKLHASKFMQILEAHRSQLLVTTMFPAEQPDAFEAVQIPIDLQLQRSVRRLSSRTRGLLEISSLGRIDYLHRTTNDWVSHHWAPIKDAGPRDYDAELAILSAKVALFTLESSWFGYHSSNEDIWQTLGECLDYACGVSNVDTSTDIVISLLDRLNSFLKYKWGESWTYDQLSISNGFLGIATQYAILLYVQAKTRASPWLVKHNKGYMSLLENALYVPGSNPLRMHSSSDNFTPLDLRFKDRENLVIFLLEQGAKPSAHA